MREVVRFFDAIAPHYDRSYARNALDLRERLETAKLPSGHVLDLGIGTGRELAWLLDAGHTVTGVELSEQMIRQCNQRARKVPIVHADFYAPLPFPDAVFDSAIALFGSLAHPPDPNAHTRLAAELARVLKPGGVLVAEMPAPAWDGRVHEDEASHARIVVRAPSEDEWRKAFASWALHFEPVSDQEIRIRATPP